VSTTTRILLCFLLLIAGGFYFLLDKLTERVERQYLEAAEEPMVDMARIIAAWMEQEYSSNGFDFTSLEKTFETAKTRPFEARIYNLLKTQVDLNVYVTDSEGMVLFDSNQGEVEGYDYHVFNDVYKTLRGEYGARSTRTNEEDELSSVMFVGAPVVVNGRIVGMVSVSKPQASMFAFIDETEQRIRFYGWSIMLLTMFAAVLVSHLFSSPIRKLTAYAKAVRKGDRVALPRLASSDVRTLGRALDEMRDALEDRKYVETYVQTLTHEMKSPVSAILGAIELLQQDFDAMPATRRSRFLGNIQSETRRLVDIIDQLLALSAIESRKALDNPFEVRLSELIEHVCALQEHQLHLHALHIDMDLDPACPPIPGDPFLLEIAVGNMIQNAIDFSPTGGTIRISLRQDPAKKRIELTVEDEGPGVPDYAIEKVFDRFYSLPHPKSGKKSSGLGLCFVREAAELHGGKASLHNRSGHHGTCACLIFQQPK
jgi:two-component system sensor histidine kinase CreC